MIPLFRPVLAPKDRFFELVGPSLDRGYTGEGTRCAELEVALTALNHTPTLLTSSGTAALKIAFVGAGVRQGRGDEVVTPPISCLATAMAAADAGATVVWCDVDPETGCIDPTDAAARVTSRTAAVCPVDWAGALCDYPALRQLLRGVSIVEDAAHAFGADRDRADSREGGDWICHSYQSIKHLSMGDGGSLSCPGAAQTEDARRDRWFGLDRTRGDSMRCFQRVSRLGYKAQSNDIAACLGLANLPYAVQAVQHCRDSARWYAERVRSLRYVRATEYDPTASYWMFPVKVSQPARFEAHMRDYGVEVGQVHARCDVQPCFSGSRGAHELPGVEYFTAHQSNLPTMPHVGADQIAKVWNALEGWDARPEARW